MKFISKLNNLPRLFSASFIATVATVGQANATGKSDLKDVTNQLTDSLEGLPVLFTSAAYIIGIGFVIAGLFKLKEFVDDPAQGNMKDALIRLGVGALMILLPFAIELSAGTIGADDGEQVTFGGGQFESNFGN